MECRISVELIKDIYADYIPCMCIEIIYANNKAFIAVGVMYGLQLIMIWQFRATTIYYILYMYCCLTCRIEEAQVCTHIINGWSLDTGTLYNNRVKHQLSDSTCMYQICTQNWLLLKSIIVYWLPLNCVLI